MYVCMYVCISIHIIYACIDGNRNKQQNVYMYISYTDILVHAENHILDINMYTCAYLCMYISMHVMYVYMYIYIYVHGPPPWALMGPALMGLPGP